MAGYRRGQVFRIPVMNGSSASGVRCRVSCLLCGRGARRPVLPVVGWLWDSLGGCDGVAWMAIGFVGGLV